MNDAEKTPTPEGVDEQGLVGVPSGAQQPMQMNLDLSVSRPKRGLMFGFADVNGVIVIDPYTTAIQNYPGTVVLVRGGMAGLRKLAQGSRPLIVTIQAEEAKREEEDM